MTRPEIATTPCFFELLSQQDREWYENMRRTLTDSTRRYKKNTRVESLRDALHMIRHFCVRRDDSDWRRCLVCGVCWMGEEVLAINTRQLRLLVDKCKSSINGALVKMGYDAYPSHSIDAAFIVIYIPFLKGNFTEQRQWTVRRRVAQTVDDDMPRVTGTIGSLVGIEGELNEAVLAVKDKGDVEIDVTDDWFFFDS